MHMALTTITIPTPRSTAETTIEGGAAASISTIHPDVIQTHILTRLDGPTLASTAATCSQLYTLSTQEHLWAKLCLSTWPSTTSPRVCHVITRRFSHGSRSFFSDSSTIPRPIPTRRNSHVNLNRTPEIISAFDLYYRQQVLLSRVMETETVSDWFMWSPFRVDILEPKEVARTPLRYPAGEDTCRDLTEGLRLSWIVIDTRGGRSVNVSSQMAVTVERHWLSGDVEVKFATAMGGEVGSATEMVLCCVLVRLVGVEGGGMLVKEGWLEMEDLDGKILNGRVSLGILQGALEGKRGSEKNVGREGYGMFVKRKRERKERMIRREETLDLVFVCVSLATLSFLGLLLFIRLYFVECSGIK